MAADFVDKVDNTPFEDEEDANHVFIAIKKKAAKYAEIGIEFGLVPSTIESIRENHPRDNSGALQDVITTWVRQKHNTTKYGLPSWRKLVEVIGKFDKPLAKRISKDHLIQVSTATGESVIASASPDHEQKLQQPELPMSSESSNETSPEECYISNSATPHTDQLADYSALMPGLVEGTESSTVTTDGPSANTRAAKSKKLAPPPSPDKVCEPLDRKKCLELLQFKSFTVQPKAGEIKAKPLSGAYKMDSECHGLALIINNATFKGTDLKERTGASVDGENLRILLCYLGYRVRIYHDVDTDAMKAILREVQQFDHTSYDSFICCILSHGAKDHIYGSNSVKVKISDLTGELNGDKCRTLIGKPKLFFIQACRGDERQIRVSADGDFLPNTTDFFFSFPVPHGYKAFEHKREGSWYVTELCKQLGEHATYAPLIEIMHLVHQRVAERYAKHDGKGISQAPEIIYRLRKHVFFFSII